MNPFASIRISASMALPAEFSPEAPERLLAMHEWIRSQAIAEDTLIDVANYEHIHRGPGRFLVGLSACYGLEDRGEGPRLRVSLRPDPRRDAGTDPLAELGARLLRFARLLEATWADGKALIRTDRVWWTARDRLLADNTRRTHDAAAAPLAAWAAGVCPGVEAHLAWASEAQAGPYVGCLAFGEERPLSGWRGAGDQT